MSKIISLEGLSRFWKNVDEKKQDTLESGTNIKTINGNSLLGGGDIEIKTSSNYPKATIQPNDDGVFVLPPNTYCILGASEVIISLGEAIDGVVSEYICEFKGESLSCPEEIVWANGDIPSLDPTKTYVVSIVNNLAVYAEF